MNNKNYISKKDLENCLKSFYDENFNDLLRAKLNGSFKEECFHLGFLACINCVKEFYDIKKDVDKEKILQYI